MDDYSITSLGESRNEWVARLIDVMTPAVIEGLESIFTEAYDICKQNDEDEKYLMTFQTFLSRIPKWNPEIIVKERERIQKTSGCEYLEDLITCVHIIQLKALTCVRVGQKQKKIDIDIPSANDFVHKVYTLAARKLYTNVYLFEKNVAPLQQQRHSRETEILIREAVMEAVRNGVPVEHILRAYMDQTEETVLTPDSSNDLEDIPQTNTATSETKTNSALPSTEPNSIAVNNPETTPGSQPPTKIQTGGETAASVQATAAPVQTTATPVQTTATPVQTTATTVQTTATPVQTAATTVQTTSTPVQTAAAPVQTAAAPVQTTTLKTPIVSTPVSSEVNRLSPLKLNNENIKISTPSPPAISTTPTSIGESNTNVSFTATDRAMSLDGNEIVINAPKDDATLEAKADKGARMRAAAEEDDDDDDKISIGDEVKLEIGELVQDLNKSASSTSSGLEEVDITPL